jgi:hypothetical protein
MKKMSVYKWYHYLIAVMLVMIMWSCEGDISPESNGVTFREEAAIVLYPTGYYSWVENSFEFDACNFNNNNCILERVVKHSGKNMGNLNLLIRIDKTDSYSSNVTGKYETGVNMTNGHINYYKLYRNDVLIIDVKNVKDAYYTEILK